MPDTLAGAFLRPICAVLRTVFLILRELDVALGSRVTIRHYNTQGGYLHSHPHNYPAGSKRKLFDHSQSKTAKPDIHRTTNHPVSSQRRQQRLGLAEQHRGSRL